MDRFLARELEIIAEMPRYYDWIIDCIRPHTAGRVIEIGAGIGALSERLLPQATELCLVEPSSHFASILRQRFEGRDNVSIHHMSVETFLEMRAEGECNAVVMANVLEHIEDDAAVLSGIRAFLGPGGKIAIFVPATPFLYSKLDQAVGHYRRYTLRSLSEGLENAGFEIIDIRYMDLLGVLPWWIVMTLMGNTTFNPRQVRLYDAVGVPLTRAFESVVRPWIGKNLLAIAERR